MREVTYYYTDDCGLDILMKKVRDPKKGIFSGFIWKVDEKVWNEKWELTCGYFYGFEPARVISEEEAKAYMIGHGAAEEEAEEIVRRDIEG